MKQLKKIWRTAKLLLLGLLLGALLTAICLAPPLMRWISYHAASAGEAEPEEPAAETPEFSVLRVRVPEEAASGAAVSADGLNWLAPAADETELALRPGVYELQAARANKTVSSLHTVYRAGADAATLVLDLARAPDCREFVILESDYGEKRAWVLEFKGAEDVTGDKIEPGWKALSDGGIFRLEAAAEPRPGFYHAVLKARAAGGEAVLHAGLRVRPAGPVTEIAAESDLRAMAYNLSGHFRLTRDIDLSAEDWQPIGSEEYPFTGVLDGGGHEIRGLNAALFGVVRQAEISELILRAPVVGEDGEAAAIAITALDSYIHDAAVLDGIVRGGEAAGCVFRAEGSVLSGLVNFAAVRSEFPSGARPYAAGIAALATNYTLVRHCVNYGNISGGYLVGGITALSAGSDITRCFSGGTVSGSLETALPPPGGIAHLVEWGRLTDCYYLEGESGAAVGAGNLSPAVIAAVTPVNAERAEEAEALTRLGEFAGAEPEWRFRPEWADGPLPAGVAALLPAGRGD